MIGVVIGVTGVFPTDLRTGNVIDAQACTKAIIDENDNENIITCESAHVVPTCDVIIIIISWRFLFERTQVRIW